MGRLVEGYWDCLQCGKKAIKGGTRECTSCGKARGEGTRFYMIDTTVLSDEESDKVVRESDWKCGFCGHLNNANDNNCKSCGASKEHNEGNYFDMVDKEEEKEEREKEEEEKQKKLEYEYSCSDRSNHRIKKIDKNVLKKIGLTGLIGILGVLIVFGLVTICKPRQVDVIISETTWENIQEIEKYIYVDDSGWTMPSDATLLYTQEEVKEYVKEITGYESVETQVENKRVVGTHEELDGYKDLGNGYFEEQYKVVTDYETYYTTEVKQVPMYKDVPVYDTKYYYKMGKWVYSRSEVYTGNKGEKKDRDRDFDLRAGGLDGEGKERLGRLTEKYIITGVIVGGEADGERVKYMIGEKDWNKISVGKIATLKVWLTGNAELVE